LVSRVEIAPIQEWAFALAKSRQATKATIILSTGPEGVLWKGAVQAEMA
jgi:hypothetical protein